MATDRRDWRWIAREFDRRADSYDASEMHRWQAGVIVAMLPALQPSELVLDVACGTGLAARGLADRRGVTSRIIGVDISMGMLRAGATAHPARHCCWLRADAEHVPLRDHVVDLVVCVSSIPYFPRVDLALREWRRVARAGARLAITTPASDGPAALRLLRAAAAERDVQIADPHAALGDAHAIATSLEPVGVTIERIEQRECAGDLDDDADRSFDRVVDYGFAPAVAGLSASRRDAVREVYRRLHREAIATGSDAHRVMFTVGHFEA